MVDGQVVRLCAHPLIVLLSAPHFLSALHVLKGLTL